MLVGARYRLFQRLPSRNERRPLPYKEARLRCARLGLEDSLRRR